MYECKWVLLKKMLLRKELTTKATLDICLWYTSFCNQYIRQEQKVKKGQKDQRQKLKTNFLKHKKTKNIIKKTLALP